TRARQGGQVGVSTAEHISVLPGYALAAELEGVVDERTLEIIDHRRRTAVVRRRGWLVRRALLVADVVGLMLAFPVSALIARGRTAGNLPAEVEFELFLLTLPVWVVAAKIYGLYDRDEERTDHSTVDDVMGVFHLVTVGAWLLFAGTWLSGIAEPDLARIAVFWGMAVSSVSLLRAVARFLCRRHVAYLQHTVIV